MKKSQLFLLFVTFSLIASSCVYAVTLQTTSIRAITLPTVSTTTSTPSDTVVNTTLTPGSTTSLTPLDDVVKNLEKKIKDTNDKLKEMNQKIDTLANKFIVKTVTVNVKKDTDYANIDLAELNNNPTAKVFIQMTNGDKLAHSVSYDKTSKKWFVSFQTYIVNGFTCDKSGKCIASAKRLATPDSYTFSLIIAQ